MNIRDPLRYRLGALRGVVLHRDDESGNSLVEYALLLALIVIVCIAAVTMISEQTQSSLSSAASHL
jgi:Flp pilus assembly pilin Flp